MNQVQTVVNTRPCIMVFETKTEPPSMFIYNKLGDGLIWEKNKNKTNNNYNNKKKQVERNSNLCYGLVWYERIISHVRFWQGAIPNDILVCSVMCAVWSLKLMPGCMLIERAEKYNVHDINSVNLLSDSGCSRQQMHYLAVSPCSLRTQSISSNC